MNTHETSSDLMMLPLLPLRDVVVYPHMVIPLFVGRSKSIAALEKAMSEDKQVLLVAQRTPSIDDPGANDLYEIGTISQILQILKLPDGTVKVLVEGKHRSEIKNIKGEAYFQASAVPIASEEPSARESEVLTKTLLSGFEQYVNLSKKVPAEVLTSISGIDEPGRLADPVAAHMSLELAQEQHSREIYDGSEGREHLVGVMEAEADVFQVEKRI